jgi:hypothetical protein
MKPIQDPPGSDEFDVIRNQELSKFGDPAAIGRALDEAINTGNQPVITKIMRMYGAAADRANMILQSRSSQMKGHNGTTN